MKTHSKFTIPSYSYHIRQDSTEQHVTDHEHPSTSKISSSQQKDSLNQTQLSMKQ